MPPGLGLDTARRHINEPHQKQHSTTYEGEQLFRFSESQGAGKKLGHSSFDIFLTPPCFCKAVHGPGEFHGPRAYTSYAALAPAACSMEKRPHTHVGEYHVGVFYAQVEL